MNRPALSITAIAASVCHAFAEPPRLLQRSAQPQTVDGVAVVSRFSTLIVLENRFSGFPNGDPGFFQLELLGPGGDPIPGTAFSVNSNAQINGRPAGSGVFAPGQDLMTVDLDFGVLPLLLDSNPGTSGMRLTIFDFNSQSDSVDFLLDERRPTLIAAHYDDTIGAEYLDLVFDADLTNLDPTTRSASREFEEAEPRPGASDGPDNEINQTSAADLASLNDFEVASDADFTTPIRIDGSLASQPRLLEDRRTIRYDIDVPALFDGARFVRVASDEITSVTNVPAAGAVMVTGAARAAACPADRNADGVVDGADLGLLLGEWGAPDADLTGDGVTDGADLGVLLGGWGSCQ
jgi:hypothetical protein